jgi:hypothetical protein
VDVVYLYKECGSQELRMSLRTLAANLPHEQLWFVGDPPPRWVKGAEWIPGNLKFSKPQNVFDNVRIAANHPDISDEFYYFNDDFFILKPVERVEMAWRGTLDQNISKVRPSNKEWHESLVITRDWLRMLGHKRPRSYELHRPLPVNKQLMAETLELASDIRPDLPPQWRTIYGVINRVGGVRDDDLKLKNGFTVDLDDHTFLSSDERCFHYNETCQALRLRFNRMCRYEAHL